MQFEKLTIKSQEALSEAQTHATSRGHAQIQPAHLLRELLGQPEGSSVPVLQKLGVSIDALQGRIAELLETLLADRYEVVVTAVAADGLDVEWLGRVLDRAAVDDLLVLANRHGLNPAGEGGELETLVLDAPLFHKRLRLVETSPEFRAGAGRTQ